MIKVPYLVEVNEQGRFACPVCGKKDRAMTQLGKIWNHEIPGTLVQECTAGGERVLALPLSGPDMVMLAEEIGRAVHANDKDKTGEPYWMHLEGVAAGVRVFAGENHEAIAAAWLHDTIEDHPSLVSVSKLREWGFNEAVVVAVEALTKKKGEAQPDYLARLIAAGEVALYTKLADLTHNTRPDRLAKLADATRVRLLKKYTPAKAAIMLQLGIIQTEEGQALATKPVGSGSTSYVTKAADGSSKYSGKALMKGDWPAGWSAPVKEKIKDHDARYLLEDDSVKSADPKVQYRVWLKPYSNPKGGVGWSPADEDVTSKPATSAPKSQVASPAHADQAAHPCEGIVDSKPCVRGAIAGSKYCGEHTSIARQVGQSTARTEMKVVQPLAQGQFKSLMKRPSKPAPSTATGAPWSICGECGRDTYQVTSGFWKHVWDLPLNEKFHAATAPTESKVAKLIAEGRVAKV